MITLNQSDFNSILEHAVHALPNEACGLIAGIVNEDGVTSIKKVYTLTNIDQSNEHFSMDPCEQLAAVKDMRSNGLLPLGNFHSHPESPSRPSTEDIRLAHDSSAVYMILSLMDCDNPILNVFRIAGSVVTKEEIILENKL